jgi:hypothetical protein
MLAWHYLMCKQHFLFLLKVPMTVLKPILKASEPVTPVTSKPDDVDEEENENEKGDSDSEVEVEKPQTDFNSLNDFKLFYLKNKKKLDDMCTIVLNKTYKIQDYIIRKNYGVLNFRKVSKDVKVSKNEQRITQLENTLNEVIEVLNQIQTRLGMI